MTMLCLDEQLDTYSGWLHFILFFIFFGLVNQEGCIMIFHGMLMWWLNVRMSFLVAKCNAPPSVSFIFVGNTSKVVY